MSHICQAFAAMSIPRKRDKCTASGAGFVTRFEVDADYLAQHQERIVGASHHREYWIPADELPKFNTMIVGKIEVTDQYGADDSRADMDALLFVNAYDGSQETAIAFAWNGKHGDDFLDSNLEFRRKVMDLALVRIDSIRLELVRDLLTAETKFAAEAWGVHPGVTKLSQALLVRGQQKYLDIYLAAMGRGMDAYCACRSIDLPRELSEELAQECKQRIESGEAGYQVLYDGLIGVAGKAED